MPSIIPPSGLLAILLWTFLAVKLVSVLWSVHFAISLSFAIHFFQQLCGRVKDKLTVNWDHQDFTLRYCPFIRGGGLLTAYFTSTSRQGQLVSGIITYPILNPMNARVVFDRFEVRRSRLVDCPSVE